MTQSTYRSRIVLLAGMLALALAAALASMGRGQPAPEPNKADDIAKLQKERIDTLTKAVTLADQMYRQGTTSSDEVFYLHRCLAGAQLEYAKTHDERMKILQDAVAKAASDEAVENDKFKAGFVSSLNPLEAKEYRLDMEIKLAQESAAGK